MKYTQQFFINNRYYGETQREELSGFGGSMRPADRIRPFSDLYVCRFCGEAFARCPCTDIAGRYTKWQVHMAVCEKCAGKTDWPFEWPGSIWQKWGEEFNAALPEEVLQYELERHLRRTEQLERKGYE